MGYYSDQVLALTPLCYWRLDETALGDGLIDATGNLANGTWADPVTFGTASPVDDGTAVTYAFGGYARSPATTNLSGLSAFTFIAWARDDGANDNANILRWYLSGQYVYINTRADGRVRFAAYDSTAGKSLRVDTTNPVNWSAVRFIAVTFDAGTVRMFIDGSEVATTIDFSDGLTAFGSMSRYHQIGYVYIGVIDEVALFNSVLTPTQIGDLYAAASGPPTIAAASLPTFLAGFVTHAAASLPTSLFSTTTISAASLPMRLAAPDPAHYGAAAARWSCAVRLAGVDISDRLTGPVVIEHAESASGLADFTLLPVAGAIDLGDYERQALEIDFEGRDSAGALLYAVRRFTGITTLAEYDPDTGTLAVSATTDLQGRLEQLPRAVIDSLIGGSWSEHVFDDKADGWRYALDRLSTRPSELHVDNYGRLVVVDWAIGTPRVTFTDASRFINAFVLTRASRRELVSRVRISFDFRFKRLRHRELLVRLVDSLGLCGWLAGEGQLPSKGTVVSAASGGAWTRLTPVTFVDLPTTPLAGICGGTNFTPSDASYQLCLGAAWSAARRWAQTVTEVYTLDLVATDLEEAIGVQLSTFDYGLEAVFDATDHERLTEFDGPPTGAVFVSASQDWQIEATDAERTGRAALATAQACALARARVLLLGRARGNRLTIRSVFDPTITLADTLRVDTPHLVATGKVAGLRETLDTGTGALDQAITLALSRHGGAGLAADDPLDAPSAPAQPSETDTGRTYYLPTHSGGVTGAPVDNEAWDGWITNAYGGARTDPANLYRERLVVRMPEIEDAARDTQTLEQPATYEVAIPEDELTLVN